MKIFIKFIEKSNTIYDFRSVFIWVRLSVRQVIRLHGGTHPIRSDKPACGGNRGQVICLWYELCE